MANDQLQLGAQYVNNGSCVDPMESISQIVSVIESLGNPGPVTDPTGTTYNNVYATTINNVTTYVTPADDPNDPPIQIGTSGEALFLCDVYVGTSATTFLVDQIDLLQGEDPRNTPGSLSETVTVKNTFSETFSSNERLMCIERSDNGQFEVVGHFDYNTGSGGGSYTAGCGIDITSSVISVDTGDGIVCDGSNLLSIDLATDSGLEFVTDTTEKLRSKLRYGTIRGTLSANAHPNAGDITLNSTTSVHGEDPPSSVTVGGPISLYGDGGDTIYAVHNTDEGSDENDQWSFATALNFIPLMKGIDSFSETGTLSLQSESGSLTWAEAPEVATETKFGKVTTLITGAVASDGSLIVGTGSMTVWGVVSGGETDEWAAVSPEEIVTVKNMASGSIPTGKHIIATSVNGVLFATAEDCA